MGRDEGWRLSMKKLETVFSAHARFIAAGSDIEPNISLAAAEVSRK